MLQTKLIAFGACIALGFTVETGVGFGGTLVAVGLGAWLLPIAEALAIFLPLNLAVSLWIVARTHRDVHARWLLAQVVPTMLLGMPLGVWLASWVAESRLKRGFGVFLLGFAIRELTRRDAMAVDVQTGGAVHSGGAVRAGLAGLGWADRLTLMLGGIAQGAFGTGGPFVAVVAGRTLNGKSAFRATLAALWAVLNVVVCAALAWRGNLTLHSLAISVGLAPTVPLAVVVGEWLHRRVPAATFRLLIQVLLFAMGLRLLLVE